MASITRSSRRAEGLHPHHGNSNSRSGPQAFPTGGGRRTKRILDVGTERDFEAIKPKKQRIAVEILAKSPATKAIADEAAPTKPARALERRTTPKPAPVNVATSQKARAAGPASEEKKPATTGSQDPNITQHQAKVINGIKHELDRLQPEANAITKEQGRKLRSQEAIRFKSDLSAYFPDYDEMIGNEPKETRE
jgi:hypothetical protein